MSSRYVPFCCVSTHTEYTQKSISPITLVCAEVVKSHSRRPWSPRHQHRSFSTFWTRPPTRFTERLNTGGLLVPLHFFSATTTSLRLGLFAASGRDIPLAPGPSRWFLQTVTLCIAADEPEIHAHAETGPLFLEYLHLPRHPVSRELSLFFRPRRMRQQTGMCRCKRRCLCMGRRICWSPLGVWVV